MKLFFIYVFYIFLAFPLYLHAYQDATAQHYSLYLCAQYNQLQKNIDQAQECYAQLSKQQAPHFYLLGYFELAFDRGDYSTIIRLAPKTKGYFDDQKDIQIIIGQSLELAGKKHEAEDIFINLYDYCKKQPDVAYYAASAHARRRSFLQALTIIDDFLNSAIQRPTYFMFYFLKTKIYQFLNQENEAAESLKKGLELYKSARR
jgi:tetratricopeptide (TPR) repeat protein